MEKVLVMIKRTKSIGLLFIILLSANPVKSEVRIKGFGNYIELKNGEVFCGEEYGSWHESRTGKVCSGGKYGSYHQGSTGENCVGGLYKPKQ